MIGKEDKCYSHTHDGEWMSNQKVFCPSPIVIDIDSLLKPCPSEDPAGISIRYEPVYDQLKELRREDEVIPGGIWATKAKTADWEGVARIAQKVLIEQSKDLQVAGWLWEALSQQYGFAGFRDGCRLVTRLIEEYWEGFYPRIEDNDLDLRAGRIEGIIRIVSHRLQFAPLFKASGNSSVSLGEWQEAKQIEELQRRKPNIATELLQEGKLDFMAIDRIFASITSDSLQQQGIDFLDAKESVEQFSRVVDERLRESAPSFRELIQLTDECTELFKKVLNARNLLRPSGDSKDETSESISGLAVEPESKGILPVSKVLEPENRADALKRLERLANYFQRTEPQSPVPYAIRRAIRWARMPLDQWLSEVIPDEATLRGARRALGVDVSDEEK